MLAASRSGHYDDSQSARMHVMCIYYVHALVITCMRNEPCRAGSSNRNISTACILTPCIQCIRYTHTKHTTKYHRQGVGYRVYFLPPEPVSAAHSQVELLRVSAGQQAADNVDIVIVQAYTIMCLLL